MLGPDIIVKRNGNSKTVKVPSIAQLHRTDREVFEELMEFYSEVGWDATGDVVRIIDIGKPKKAE